MKKINKKLLSAVLSASMTASSIPLNYTTGVTAGNKNEPVPTEVEDTRIFSGLSFSPETPEITTEAASQAASGSAIGSSDSCSNQ